MFWKKKKKQIFCKKCDNKKPMIKHEEYSKKRYRKNWEVYSCTNENCDYLEGLNRN